MNRGLGDKWSEYQPVIQPELDLSLVGFNLEMRFSYNDDDGMAYLNWARGEVKKVVCRGKG